MVTEEKALETLSTDDLKELQKFLSRDWKEWEHLRNSVVHNRPSLDRKDFREIVRWLKSWRKQDPSTEELLLAFLTLILASYVESDIEKRFEKVFADKFLSVLK